MNASGSDGTAATRVAITAPNFAALELLLLVKTLPSQWDPPKYRLERLSQAQSDHCSLGVADAMCHQRVSPMQLSPPGVADAVSPPAVADAVAPAGADIRSIFHTLEQRCQFERLGGHKHKYFAFEFYCSLDCFHRYRHHRWSHHRWSRHRWSRHRWSRHR